MKALVVEDSTDVALMLKQFLVTEGCEVAVAATGSEGLSLWWGAVDEGEPFTLIFMDFALPGPGGLDGLEVTRRIRSAEENTGVKPSYICGYTAHPQNVKSPGAVRRAGLDKLLIKADGDVASAIKEVVGEARGRV
jgi:two-component system sensor histidine kinase BarA